MTLDLYADIPSDQVADLVRHLYRAFLSREPVAEEIAYHVGFLQSGSPLAALNAIVLSQEAAAVRVRRHEPDYSKLGEDQLVIQRDDVIELLTQALASTREEKPSNDEIMIRFDDFCRGTGLATILKDTLRPRAPPVRVSESQDEIDSVVRTIYNVALRRMPGPEELHHWSSVVNDRGRLSDAILGICDSEEARLARQQNYGDAAPGVMVQIAFETVRGRGASAHEVDNFRAQIESGNLDVSTLVTRLFNEEARQRLSAAPVTNDPNLAYLFGSRGVVSASSWNRDAKDIVPRKILHDVLGRGSAFRLDQSDGCAVSIITSVYCGGDFIRPFLDNITSQTIFRSHCELIIIDANSSDGEHVVIDEYRQSYPNIVYKRMDSRIGIYDAWNIGISLAKGKYLTNANLDDCRRSDSLEIQTGVLDSLDFVDVTYQEVLYSFTPKLSFDEIEGHNFQTSLPIVSRYNLTEFNSPHNAPMWRKSLHDDVGLFNDSLKSAGDFEFWIRCRLRDKVFYKVNDPHVAYYVNPKGISTRPDTRGLVEANRISQEYYRKIVSPLLTVSQEKFLQEVDGVVEAPLRTGRRYEIVQSALLELGSASMLPSGGDAA